MNLVHERLLGLALLLELFGNEPEAVRFGVLLFAEVFFEEALALFFGAAGLVEDLGHALLDLLELARELRIGGRLDDLVQPLLLLLLLLAQLVRRGGLLRLLLYRSVQAVVRSWSKAA